MCIKLSKRTATELIRRICPNLKVTKEPSVNGSVSYVASIGGIDIRCENDWDNYSGRIRLSVCVMGDKIVQYYNPDTLNRDYGMEKCARQEADAVARRAWAQSVGADVAHKMVDQYWDG